MVLSDREIRKRIKERKLVVKPFRDEDVQPSSIDLHLGDEFLAFDNHSRSFIDTKSDVTNLMKKIMVKKDEPLMLHPREFVLGTTIESVKLPEHITANLWARSTLYRSGIILSGGNVAPGYEGKLSFTLFNCGKCPVSIELGARIVHILFFEVSGKSNAYRGQWKGGRVTAQKLEKQV